VIDGAVSLGRPDVVTAALSWVGYFAVFFLVVLAGVGASLEIVRRA